MDAGIVPMRLSGRNNSWLETYGPHSVWGDWCFYADSVGPIYTTAGSFERDILDETVSDSQPTYYFPPELFEVDINIICNPKGKEEEQ